jgi:hypothetical protein
VGGAHSILEFRAWELSGRAQEPPKGGGGELTRRLEWAQAMTTRSSVDSNVGVQPSGCLRTAPAFPRRASAIGTTMRRLRLPGRIGAHRKDEPVVAGCRGAGGFRIGWNGGPTKRSFEEGSCQAGAWERDRNLPWGSMLSHRPGIPSFKWGKPDARASAGRPAVASLAWSAPHVVGGISPRCRAPPMDSDAYEKLRVSSGRFIGPWHPVGARLRAVRSPAMPTGFAALGVVKCYAGLRGRERSV